MSFVVSAFVVGLSLHLAADVLADQVDEAALRALAKLIVMRGLLAHHEASAMVAGVEPFCCGCGGAAAAVETYARAHFDERSALRKFCRFLVLDPNQRHALIVLQHAHGTDRDRIAGFRLADGSPVAGREYHGDHEYRGEYD